MRYIFQDNSRLLQLVEKMEEDKKNEAKEKTSLENELAELTQVRKFVILKDAGHQNRANGLLF